MATEAEIQAGLLEEADALVGPGATARFRANLRELSERCPAGGLKQMIDADVKILDATALFLANERKRIERLKPRPPPADQAPQE